MTDASDRFEQLVQRIHELIEQPGSLVTWDDRVADPDNPAQSRQIDVTVRRDSRLTIIECRFRSRPQDVAWIEELIGRRASLHADAVIAVSYSGFTAGAHAKAQAYGVILRDFHTLTIEEIQRWGKATRISLTLLEYLSIELNFGIPEAHWSSTTREIIKDRNVVSAALWPALNEVACKTADMGAPSGTEITGACLLTFRELACRGVPILEARVTVKLKCTYKDVELASVVAYDSPEREPHERSVMVERDEDRPIEILQSSNLVSVDADLSPAELPKNTQIHGCLIDFGRVVRAKFVRMVGLKPPQFEDGVIKTRAHKVTNK